MESSAQLRALSVFCLQGSPMLSKYKR